ncbi:hypothetical protein PG987_014507 [Apiospora arundinis]
MAEVIGLTASIVSLVDIAIKIVSTGRSLYGSLNDTPDEIGRLSLVIEDIRRRNFPLRQRAVARPHDLCEDEKEAMKLANECDDIVKKLNKIFDKLKIRDGHSRTLEVTRVTFRQLMGKKEVTDLCTQLRLLDKQVRINMNRALQGQVSQFFFVSFALLSLAYADFSHRYLQKEPLGYHGRDKGNTSISRSPSYQLLLAA